MLLVQGHITLKNITAFDVPIGCARFGGYCDKMYSNHLFSTQWIRAVLGLVFLAAVQCLVTQRSSPQRSFV